ncbi:MAG: 5-formyltetrahydrofolate cyclo-ligase [Pseudomonadota bacterium]
MIDIDADKRALRRRMRALRGAVPDRAARTDALLARAAALLGVDASFVLAGYVGIGSEVDPVPLLAAHHAKGGALALPVAAAESPLAFRAWRPGETLRAGAFRVPEPVGGASIVPDVLLVPLLAFDADRWRLGQGGGHYDRTLAQPAFAQARTIGLAFDAQEAEAIPRDRFDRRLDAIVTETRTLRA